MNLKNMSRPFVAAALLLALVPLGALARSQAPPHLVIFGDSLSDPGNFYAAFHLESVAPYQPIPGAPYEIGADHFSNGPTWIEQLARRLHISSDARPALSVPGVYRNFAVGGARSRAGSPFPYFDLSTQVGLFANSAQGQAPADATYVIWIGGNDERDALADLAVGDSASAGAVITAAVTATASNIQALWAMGARKFLVLTAPDTSFTPFVASLGVQAQGAAAQIALLYNGGLNQALAALRALPGADIRELDVNATIEAAMAASTGDDEVRNFTNPCLHFGVITHAVCEEPEDHFFWDGIHPTTAGHQLVADAALQVLTATR